MSNRSKWLAALIVLLALPPIAMRIVSASMLFLVPAAEPFLRQVGWIYQVPSNEPSPFNCGASSFLPPTLWIPCVSTPRVCITTLIDGQSFPVVRNMLFFVFPSFKPLQFTVTLVIRVPQLASELLVVGITWWYTYESYRIRKGTKLGNTISSLLFYNGEWTHGRRLPHIILIRYVST